ncbi:MAG: T9SS type A sorting domain-containing protein [Bacteroidales bacterium]|nr:T9SS type A sorting domain-containing protein [Bacteroidales bacterium]
MKYYNKIIIAISSLLFIGLMMKNERVLAQRPLHPEIRCFQGYQDRDDDRQRMLDESATTGVDISVYFPRDPNEIRGTVGYDDHNSGDTLQWVSASQSLPYTIYFENDPEMATAAAQRVEVRHQFHPLGNLATFGIGAFGFGEHVFEVEGSPSSYQRRLDLIESMGIYVDVVAGVDVVTNEAFWVFQSIDPATGLPPQGAEQGFLPINDEDHKGEGFVTFTIKPKSPACSTRDVITASASIVFDVNEAINTNVWGNTIDALPPTSQVTGEEAATDELLLHFIGQDDEDGCGIKQYKLYVSDNYSAFKLHDIYPLGSDATYATEYNHCYRFISLGEDNVGNVEDMKSEPDFEYGNYNLVVSVVASPEEAGTVTGAGTYVYDSQVTLSATPNAEYAFKRWTHNGMPVSEDYIYTFAVHEDLELVAEFELVSIVSMEYELVEGWNWWSSCIDLSRSGLTSLEDALSEHGRLIKSQWGGFVVNEDGHWYGNISGFDNRSMYRILTNADVPVTMMAPRVNLSQLDIELAAGWNWIGYPLSEIQTVEEALSDIEADLGDMVKSHSEFSIFEGDGEWFGMLHYMVPGQGYMYRSGQPHSFHYHNGRSIVENEEERDMHWTTDVSLYPDNMSVVATVYVDGEEQQSDQLEVGAFSEGKMVGSAQLRYNARRDRWYALIPVSGNDGEEISFRLYDDASKSEYGIEAEERLSFTADEVIGSLDDPMALHFQTSTGIGENTSAMLHIYPNPVKRGGEIRLGLPDDAGKVRVELYNVLEVLVSAKETTGDSVTLNDKVLPGTYILKVFAETGKVYYGKLIVK